MQSWRSGLADVGDVHHFEYRYMEEGRKAPDRMPKLLDRHSEALDAALDGDRPVVLVGKSMGSRVGCHLVTERLEGRPVAGLVCLGYPLQGRSNVRDEVLLALDRPVLFVQGTRDRLCPLELLADVRPKMTAPNDLYVVEGGDHSLQLRKGDLAALGTTQDAVDRAAQGAVRAWIRDLVG